MKKAIVVFSGGQVQIHCPLLCKKHFKEVELVTFNYGQRHDTEIEVLKTNCTRSRNETSRFRYVIIITTYSKRINTTMIWKLLIMKMVYLMHFVSARNLLFLSFAGAPSLSNWG